jgi:uncharacterized protein
MSRIFFWLLIAFAIFLGIKSLKPRSKLGARSAGDAPAKVESMVRCVTCGLNVPQSEALRDGDQWYCGKEHLRGGAERRRDG